MAVVQQGRHVAKSTVADHCQRSFSSTLRAFLLSSSRAESDLTALALRVCPRSKKDDGDDDHDDKMPRCRTLPYCLRRRLTSVQLHQPRLRLICFIRRLRLIIVFLFPSVEQHRQLVLAWLEERWSGDIRVRNAQSYHLTTEQCLGWTLWLSHREESYDGLCSMQEIGCRQLFLFSG